MKKHFLLLLTFICFNGLFGQIPAYYDPVDLTLSGLELKADLSDLIISTNTSPISYSDVWDVLKTGDLDPTNAAVVLLIYGYDDTDADIINDRTRDKNANGGSVGEWNREHVFPKSLGSPDLGTVGPGSDPHNLRASDVQFNGNRSNRKYATGAGNAGTVGPNWYPGDEWIGDAARIIMYMYLRYGNRCLPAAVAVGSTNAVDPNMVSLLLEWNALDEVSELEENRNNAIQSATGNRNPFIDNPALATRIWGGEPATDTWGNLAVTKTQVDLAVYPNPTNGHVYITTTIPVTAVSVTTTSGQLIYTQNYTSSQANQPILVDLTTVAKGTYFTQIFVGNTTVFKKIVVR